MNDAPPPPPSAPPCRSKIFTSIADWPTADAKNTAAAVCGGTFGGNIESACRAASFFQASFSCFFPGAPPSRSPAPSSRRILADADATCY
eukprot:CAMPEP_0197591916 /NCGR_PEP_ID=MMETSP1326-20131121/14086_1 /TAXON_ID=1155430 /ORGANISM="Genus nov. species nov., Strain RCC2288" /LENGTH=89 /DNA_ID=CAMNT_0043157499 /DNA_START=16 /DNA_END=285 /DNA_ORIENTATION=-